MLQIETVRSAVAVVETLDVYVVEQRPDMPGRLACPGQVNLLGGTAEPYDKSFADTIARELSEEVRFSEGCLRPIPLIEVKRPGVDKDGLPVMRHIGLFRVILPSVKDIEVRPGTELWVIDKKLKAVNRVPKLAKFADWVLKQDLGGYEWPLA